MPPATPVTSVLSFTYHFPSNQLPLLLKFVLKENLYLHHKQKTVSSAINKRQMKRQLCSNTHENIHIIIKMFPMLIFIIYLILLYNILQILSHSKRCCLGTLSSPSWPLFFLSLPHSYLGTCHSLSCLADPKQHLGTQTLQPLFWCLHIA